MERKNNPSAKTIAEKFLHSAFYLLTKKLVGHKASHTATKHLEEVVFTHLRVHLVVASNDCIVCLRRCCQLVFVFMFKRLPHSVQLSKSER